MTPIHLKSQRIACLCLVPIASDPTPTVPTRAVGPDRAQTQGFVVRRQHAMSGTQAAAWRHWFARDRATDRIQGFCGKFATVGPKPFK